MFENESDQARKSTGRMPKALIAEEGRGKLRKAARSCKQATMRGYPNGGTHRGGKTSVPYAESIGIWGAPGEVKHLSTRRKRKKDRFSE